MSEPTNSPERLQQAAVDLQLARQDGIFAALLQSYVDCHEGLCRAALSDRLEELGLAERREEILGECDMLSALGFIPD